MKVKSLVKYVFRPAVCIPATLLLLSGCQIGKHYTRPDLELPSTLTMDGMVEDSASIADYSWEAIYPDTLLQGLIRKMLDYNKDLLMINLDKQFFLHQGLSALPRCFPSDQQEDLHILRLHGLK